MENEQLTVPYIVHESAMARNERHIHRLVIALIVSIVMLVLSNLAWLYMWNSYEYAGSTSETTYSQDGEGVNIIGDSNNYGTESDSKKSNSISEKEER